MQISNPSPTRKIRLLASELARRKKAKSAPVNILAGSFPEQITFIRDPARRKILLCSRRSGKSYGVGLAIIQCGLMHPGCTMTYISLTYAMGQRIMLKDIIEPINRKFKLGLHITTASGMQVHFPNGSICYVIGLDSDERQRDKVLGQKQHLVAIDEAQSMTINMADLIERVIVPQTLEVHGQIILSGTPCDDSFTLFYELTKEYQSVKGWSYHSWLYASNPYVAQAIAEEIAEILKAQPGYELTPSYQQQYERKWTIDAKSLVYRVNPTNFIVELPQGLYFYVLGVDLGWTDASAFSLLAFSQDEKDHHIYILHCQKSSGFDLTTVSQIIKNYQRHYQIHKIVIDGANRQGVEEMRRRLGVPLTIAEKQGKHDYINLMNMDYDLGRIKILPEAQGLVDEYDKLTWVYNERFRKRMENPGAPNHICDSALYSYREIYNWDSKDPVNPPLPIKTPPTYQEHVKAMEAQMAKEMEDFETGKPAEDDWDRLAKQYELE